MDICLFKCEQVSLLMRPNLKWTDLNSGRLLSKDWFNQTVHVLLYFRGDGHRKKRDEGKWSQRCYLTPETPSQKKKNLYLCHISYNIQHSETGNLENWPRMHVLMMMTCLIWSSGDKKSSLCLVFLNTCINWEAIWAAEAEKLKTK